MKIRISSAYATRIKVHVLIFADLINYHIVIFENTQAQYFDNLTRNSTMTVHSCVKFGNINALFLATYTEPILVFVRKKI